MATGLPIHCLIIKKFINAWNSQLATTSKFFSGPSGESRGGKGGASVPPFGLHLTLRSTDDKLNGTPLSGYRYKKTAAMAHLRMLRRKFVRKQIDWTGRAGSLSQNDRNVRGFAPKWAWLLKFCAQHYYYPPSTNPGSATGTYSYIQTCSSNNTILL